VKNVCDIGDAPLEIDSIKTDTGCFKVISPSVLPVSIAKGDSIPIVLRFSATRSVSAHDTCFIYSDDPKTPIVKTSLSGKVFIRSWIIKGSSTTEITLYDFGNITVGDTATQTFGYYNASNITTDTLFTHSANGLASPFKVTVYNSNIAIPPTVLNGAIFTIEFTPQAVGLFTDTCITTCYAVGIGGDTVYDTFNLIVQGTGVAAKFTTSPDTLNYGKIFYEDSSILYVHIMNEGTDVGTIDSFKLFDTTHYKVYFSPCTLAVNDTQKYRVRFYPKEVAVCSSKVIFYLTNDPARVCDTVYLVGEGGRPNLVFSPSVVNFDSVLVGDTVVDSVYLYNNGNYTGVITNVSQSTNAWLVGVPDTLLEGDTALVKVYFYPSAEQQYNLGLLVWYNGGSLGNNTGLVVTGVGVLPHFASIDTFDFGNVRVLNTRIDSIFVTDTGGYELVIDTIELNLPFGYNQALPCTIAPNETLWIEVSFTPDTCGDTTGYMVFYNNEGVDTVVLLGQGTRGKLVVSDTILNYPDVKTGFDMGQVVTLKNVGNDTLWLTYTNTDTNNLFFVFGAPSYLLPDSSKQVSINARPDTTHDTITYYADILWCADYSPGSETLVTHLVCNVIYPWPIWELTDTLIDLRSAPISVGATQKITNTLINHGWYRGWIDSTKVEGQYFSLLYAPDKVEARSQDDFVVSFTPLDTGNYVCTVDIFTTDTVERPTSDTTRHSHFTYTILTRCEGVANFVLTDTILDFGDVWFTKYDTQTVYGYTYIKNVGDGGAYIDSIVIDKFVAQLAYGSLPYYLGSGDSVLMEVSFTPKDTGKRVETGKVYYVNKTTDFTARARGVAPYLDAENPFIGKVRLIKNDTFSLSYENTGSYDLKVKFTPQSGYINLLDYDTIVSPKSTRLLNFVFTDCDTGLASVTFKIWSNAVVGDTISLISYRGYKPIPYSPDTAEGNEGETIVFYIKNLGNDTFMIDSARSPYDVVYDSIILPHDSGKVEVALAKSKAIYSQGKVILYGKARACTTQVIFMSHPIFVTEGLIDFGDVWINDTLVRNFIIKNIGHEQGQIVSASVSQPFGFETGLPITIDAQDSIVVSCSFNPTDTGKFIDTLKLTGDDELQIALTGHGVVALIFVRDTSLNVRFTKHDTYTIPIFNTGNTNLLVSSCVLSDTIANCIGFSDTITAYGNGWLSLVFDKKTDTLPHSFYVSFTTNAENDDTLFVNYKMLYPIFCVEDTFFTTQVGDTFKLNIENLGNDTLIIENVNAPLVWEVDYPDNILPHDKGIVKCYTSVEGTGYLTFVTNIGTYRVGINFPVEEKPSLKYRFFATTPAPCALLTFTLPKRELVKIEIYDIVGRLVYKECRTYSAGNYLVRKSLPQGVYFAKVTLAKRKWLQKFVVVK